jgi:hypothetical protein
MKYRLGCAEQESKKLTAKKITSDNIFSFEAV